MNPWKLYRRTGIAEMREWTPGLDMTHVSVSETDTPEKGGMVARNPKDHDDQWYVAAAYFAANMELVDG